MNRRNFLSFLASLVPMVAVAKVVGPSPKPVELPEPQVFTSSGTWKVPKAAGVEIIAVGGGGGSGRVGATGQVRYGAGGAGGQDHDTAISWGSGGGHYEVHRGIPSGGRAGTNGVVVIYSW